MNSKGYRMLSPCIRVVQGDGISYETLDAILDNMKLHKWSADNLVFGSGGALLQRLDRDTQKCAFKCSYAVINGKEVRDIRLMVAEFWGSVANSFGGTDGHWLIFLYIICLRNAQCVSLWNIDGLACIRWNIFI